MSDKYRNCFSIPVTFSDGELPTATKMNGLSSQAKNGLSLVEYAIGDIWNQAGDAVFDLASDAALMIPNIARFLGKAALANPQIPYLPLIDEYTHEFTNDAGTLIHEAHLEFPAVLASTYTWGGPSCPTHKVALKSLVQAPGDYYINATRGDVYTYDLINANWRLTYNPVVNGDLGDVSWNVIPDPDQSIYYSYKCVKIQYVNGVNDADGYYIFLPPRGPLYTRRPAQAPQDVDHTPANAYNYQSLALETNPRLFWQDSSQPASTGTNAEHYRYCLPKLLTDNWAQDATLPSGFLYLWDYSSTGTIIDGLVFKAEDTGTPRKYVLVAEGSNLTDWLATPAGVAAYPVARLQSALHTPTYYPDAGLRLITVGSSISNMLTSTLTSFLNHDHGNDQTGLTFPRVRHGYLSGLQTEQGTPVIPASPIKYDDHPMYLERHGYSASRDRYKNMLLGDLVLSSTASGGDYQNLLADSQKVVFGDATLGSDIGYDYTSKSLQVDLVETSDIGKFKIANKNGATEYITFALSNVSPEVNVMASSQPLWFISSTSGTPSNVLSIDGTGVGLGVGNYRFTPESRDTMHMMHAFFDTEGPTGWEPKTLLSAAYWSAPSDGALKVINLFVNDCPQDAVLTHITIYAKVPTTVGSKLVFYPFGHAFSIADPGADIYLYTSGGGDHFVDLTSAGGTYIPYTIGPLSIPGWKKSDGINRYLTFLKFSIATAAGVGGDTYEIKPYCLCRWLMANASPWK